MRVEKARVIGTPITIVLYYVYTCHENDTIKVEEGETLHTKTLFPILKRVYNYIYCVL